MFEGTCMMMSAGCPSVEGVREEETERTADVENGEDSRPLGVVHREVRLHSAKPGGGGVVAAEKSLKSALEIGRAHV